MGAIGFGPSLALAARAPTQHGFDFTTGVLPPGATLTRASPGTRIGPGGTMVIEPADVPRFDHDPATGALRGLLIEPERQNLVPWSTSVAVPAWTTNGTELSTDAADLFGTTGGGRFTSTGGNALHIARAPETAFAPAKSYTFSCYIAPVDGLPRIQLTPSTSGGLFASPFANFGLTDTGEVLASDGCTACIGRSARGFFWCQLTAQTNAIGGVTSAMFAALIPGATAGRLTTSPTIGSFVIGGAQLEQADDATSLIVTGSGAASRAADVLTLDWGSRGAPDGSATIRYRFDDGSTQDVATTIANGRAAVPTTLSQRRITRAERR